MPSARLALLDRHLPNVPVRLWIAAALVLHVATAWLHGGFLNADEHYQILEFAWWRLGHAPASDLAWEFAARIRPAIQPAIAAGVIHGFELAGAFNPFVAAFVLRLASALLGLWVTVALCARVVPALTRDWLKPLAFAASLFLWVAPALHSRFSAENWGGIWLFAAVCLVLDSIDAWPASRPRSVALAAAAGVAAGVAFYCRFQVGFALAGLGAWMLARRLPFRLVLAVAAAGLAMIGLNVCVDRWFYGDWLFTPLNYFHVNVVQGRASTFGVSPPWATLVPFLVVLGPPVSLAFVAIAFAGCWFARRHPLVWVIVPFVAAHAMVPHKEARFMIPVLYGLVPLLAVSVDSLPARLLDPLGRWISRPTGRAGVSLIAAANAVALGVLTIVPINERAALLQWLWEESRSAPITLYSAARAPYDDLLPLNYYRPPGVRVVPLERLGAVGTSGQAGERNEAAARSFVLYEGVHPPRLLASRTTDCPTIARTLPDWVVENDRFGWLSGESVWTVCKPDSTWWASLPAPDFRRPAFRAPSRD
jgi:GPI mannosyltransferase 3